MLGPDERTAGSALLKIAASQEGRLSVRSDRDRPHARAHSAAVTRSLAETLDVARARTAWWAF